MCDPTHDGKRACTMSDEPSSDSWADAGKEGDVVTGTPFECVAEFAEIMAWT